MVKIKVYSKNGYRFFAFVLGVLLTGLVSGLRVEEKGILSILGNDVAHADVPSGYDDGCEGTPPSDGTAPSCSGCSAAASGAVGGDGCSDGSSGGGCDGSF